jgi:precorrin-6B C5,15-methyltransferase / cobalt-precorrin-6B C5,C15-methyltransferase
MTAKSAAWLSIIGIGEDGLDAVAPAGRALIEGAEVLVGGDRHLAMIPASHKAERLTWRTPLSDTVADLAARKGRAVCVLATGDPMSYGIGVTLGRAFGRDALTVLPAPGAFSLAAAHLGWPLEEVTRLTLHGRPLSLLSAHLEPGARLFILSENAETPAQVAGLLTAEGYGASSVVVLEHLGGPKQRVIEGVARGWDIPAGADLNTIAVLLQPEPGAAILSKVPGLPDEAFHHDGQMTKREVRAATLAKLMPRRGAMLWDVGAGCGSVAIEWMRAGGKAVAIERDKTRCRLIARNAASLGTPHLDLIEGPAPEAYGEIKGAPDAIFLGGGVSKSSMAEIAWERLAPGGMLVANAVTMESETRLAGLFADWGGDLTRIAVSRLEPVGPYHGWRPLMPVTQYSIRKPL